jgi:hypothetical protein
MAFSHFISSLRQEASAETQILVDSSENAFKAALERWSNIDLKVPSAIIRPATEQDAVTIICTE